MKPLVVITLCALVALPTLAAASVKHAVKANPGARNQSRVEPPPAAPDDGDDGDADDAPNADDDESAQTSPEWPPAPLDPAAVAGEATKLLAEPSYGFCHDPHYPLRTSEAQWCHAAVAARCPQLPAACAQLKPDEEPTRRWSPGEWWSTLASLVFWGFILFLLGGLVLLIVRLAAAGGALFTRDDAAPEAAATPAETLLHLPAGEPERDVERLLAAAERLAATGDHARAIDLVYAALLRHLEARGLVRVRRDSTNGDYVRALRKTPELQALLRDVVGAVERVQFGAEPPSPERYAGLLARVTALLARPLTMLVLLLVALGAGGCVGGNRGPVDDTPSGRSALRRLFAEHGGKLSHRIAALDKLDSSTRGLVITVPLEEPQLAKVHDWAERGGVAIFAGVRAIVDDTLQKTLHPADRDALPIPPSRRDYLGDLHTVTPGVSCLRGSADDYVLLGDIHCAAVVIRQVKRGDFIFVTDGGLFTNGALTAGDDATLALELLRLADEHEVEIVDETTGMSASSPIGSLLAGGLGALLLQLLLVTLLLFAHRGVAFGQRMDPTQRQRREFAEHVRAVGMQYWKARAYRHALALWGGWAIERMRLRAGVPAAEPARLVRALAARSGEPEATIAALIAAVQRARSDDASGGGNERATMAELHRLLHKVGGNK